MFRWEEESPYFAVKEVFSPGTVYQDHLIDVVALRALNALRKELGSAVTVNVWGLGLSLRGVRSWAEQEGLIKMGLTTAKHSMHCLGKGFDVSSKGVDLGQVVKAAEGVGFTFTKVYPEKGFVHIDTRTRWNWEQV